MKTLICDKCKESVKNLEDVREEYGKDIHLCGKCLTEANGLLSRIHDETINKMKAEKIRRFQEWVNLPKTEPKKKWYQF